MPRFYFDVQNGAMMADREGQECADPSAARKAACRKAAELLENGTDRLWYDGAWTIWVRDEKGQRLFSVAIVGSAITADRGMWHEDHAAAWSGWAR